MKRLLTLTLLLLMGASVAPARAAKFEHARSRQIKAAVLLVPSTSFTTGRQALPAPANRFAPLGQNWNPHIFYIADERRDLKPVGWEFVNPLAPATVTDTQALRWAQIHNGQSPIAVGQPLSKHMAPYWEVILAPENLARLKELDIVYIGAATPTEFTLTERELLRRMADAGVTLWFDNVQNFRIPNPTADLFLPLDFGTGGGSLGILNTGHPLLAGAYRLTQAELSRLGDTDATNRAVVLLPPDSSTPQPVLQPVQPNGPIGTPYIAATRYGSGIVLATAGNVGGAINAPVGPPMQGWPNRPNNGGAISGLSLLGAPAEDLKLLYNLVTWAGEQDQFQKGPRRYGASNEQLTGFVERWGVRETGFQGAPWVAPLISHGMVFGASYTPGGYVIHAFEANPVDNFDLLRETQANEPPKYDDGNLLVDISRGRNFDEIGRWAGGTNLAWVSGLALGRIADANDGNPILFVTGGSGPFGQNPTGSIAVVQALAAPTPGNPTLTPIAQWNPPTGGVGAGTGRNLYAPPVFHDGILYAAGGQAEAAITASGGEIRALTLRNGQLGELWHYPAGNAYTSIGPIVGAPAVGYVEDPRTGAVDLTVFFTTLQSAASPGGLGGIVVATKAEPLAPADEAGRTWQPSRNTLPWDKDQPWDIRVIDNATGLVAARYAYTGTATNGQYIGANANQVEFNVDNTRGRLRLPTPAPPGQFTVVADYFLQGQPDNNTVWLDRRYWLPVFNVPGVQAQPSGIAGGPVIAKDDVVAYATGNGHIAAAQFAGNQAYVRWKVRIPNADAFTGASMQVDPGQAGRLDDYAFVASPAASSDLVYFAGRDGVVYALEANPLFQFKVPAPRLPGQPEKRPMHSARAAQVVVYSNEGTGAPRTNRLPPGSFSVDAESGTVTIHDFRNLTIDLGNMPTDAQGNLQSIDPIRRPGITLDVDYVDDLGQTVQDQVFVPVHLVYRFSTGRGTAFPDPERFSSAPVVMGDSVFVTSERGVVYELPADPRKEDPEFRMGTELATYLNGSFVRGRAVTPAGPGARPVISPPAVANGLVAMSLWEGITAFQSPTVTVADANRILEIGGGGDTLTTLDATVKHLLAGSDFPIPSDPVHALIPNAEGRPVITQKLGVDRPLRVRKLSRNSSLTSIFFSSAPTEPGIVSEHSDLADESWLIADTGNNRVVEVNPAGKVVWELKNFQDPFRILQPGESLTLANPSDVQRWVQTEQDPANPNGPPLLVIHTLIADTGNNRVLEIVDKVRYQQGKYTPDSYVEIPNQTYEYRQPGQSPSVVPVRWYHVLVWASQTNAQGLKFNYKTAQRVPLLDASGQLIPNPGVNPNQSPRPALNRPPYLPAEPFQMTTMATVANQQVLYETNPQSPNFGFTRRNIPLARPGGDSILFLRSNRTDPNEPFRQPDPTAPNNPERVIYVQGTVDSGLPIIREIFDYDTGGRDSVVHTLQGVTSVQRTVRFDRWIDSRSGQPREGQAIWYLIADQGGVFEVRFDPTVPVPAGSQVDPRARLAWAFTNDDYNWVTGGGNGNRNQLRDAQSRYVNGRVLTASSAQRLPSGQVLVVSRTAPNPQSTVPLQGAGGDIFILRPSDYIPGHPTNGWRQDIWVQRAFPNTGPAALPSVTWRSPAPRNPLLPPGLDPSLANFNPLETRGTYAPESPVFADLVF